MGGTGRLGKDIFSSSTGDLIYENEELSDRVREQNSTAEEKDNNDQWSGALSVISDNNQLEARADSPSNSGANNVVTRDKNAQREHVSEVSISSHPFIQSDRDYFIFDGAQKPMSVARFLDAVVYVHNSLRENLDREKIIVSYHLNFHRKGKQTTWARDQAQAAPFDELEARIRNEVVGNSTMSSISNIYFYVGDLGIVQVGYQAEEHLKQFHPGVPFKEDLQGKIRDWSLRAGNFGLIGIGYAVSSFAITVMGIAGEIVTELLNELYLKEIPHYRVTLKYDFKVASELPVDEAKRISEGIDLFDIALERGIHYERRSVGELWEKFVKQPYHRLIKK